MMDGLAGLELIPWAMLLIAVLGTAGLIWVITVAVRSTRPQLPSPPDMIAPAHTAHTIVIDGVHAALSEDTVAEIDRLVAAEQKIQAIKVYRDHTDVSLREAKNAIDRWVVGSAPATTAIPLMTSSLTDAMALRSSLPTSVATEIDRLVAAEQAIAAIKLLREHSGLGLKQSKDAIDVWPTLSL